MSEEHGNFALLLERTCQRQPARTSLLQRGKALSYAELAGLVDAFAVTLSKHGAGAARSVALWLPNSPAYVAAFFATLWLGGTVAPLGVLLRPREVRQRLEVARPAVLVTTPALAEQLRDCATPVLAVEPSGPELERAGGFGAAVARAGHDVAVLMFTSGTTGVAKAAMVTHAGLAWNTRALIETLELTDADVQLAAPPLSHVLGMTGVMCTTLVSGGAIALMDRFDPSAALMLMTEAGATVAMGAPPMFIALVREAEKSGRAPRLRLAHLGGASAPGEVIRSVEETFGCVVREGYGMSEVGGCVAATPVRAARKPQSVGPALPGSELRIVDLAGHELVSLGERGEVQVKSPSVMRGYHGDPEATRAAVDGDGWLSTGDIGYLDADGYLFLVDRKKEIIIRSGYNVYPREVEEVLFGVPGVREAAVVGVPHDEYGEEIVALVVPAHEGVDAEVVKALAREQLAAYKYPRHVILVEELPKGPTGKVAKREVDRAAVIALLSPDYAKQTSNRPPRS